MAGRLKSAALAMLALLAGAANCFGQSDTSLPDPMRPPAAAGETAPAASTGSEGMPATSNGLQTIILGRGRKPMAVINGIAVGLGDKVGEARLVKLSETQAVLQGPGGKETLYLTPGVERTGSLKLKQSGDPKHGVVEKTLREPTP
jgi:MSHA biogenesis protein MshK